jgi:hypothetical protein
MIGFKAFYATNCNPDENILYAYNNFQYEIGKTYETLYPLKFCYNGFHFCEMPYDLDKYCKPSENVIYALVYILGDVMYETEYHNAITNKIHIAKKLNRKELLDYCKDGKFETGCGDIFYFKDKKFHNMDGPAIIRKNCYQAWYMDGFPHRDPMTDEPTIISKNGYQWYFYGKLHRNNNLPAIQYFNGNTEYYIYGKKYHIDTKLSESIQRYT